MLDAADKDGDGVLSPEEQEALDKSQEEKKESEEEAAKAAGVEEDRNNADEEQRLKDEEDEKARIQEEQDELQRQIDQELQEREMAEELAKKKEAEDAERLALKQQQADDVAQRIREEQASQKDKHEEVERTRVAKEAFKRKQAEQTEKKSRDTEEQRIREAESRRSAFTKDVVHLLQRYADGAADCFTGVSAGVGIGGSSGAVTSPSAAAAAAAADQAHLSAQDVVAAQRDKDEVAVGNACGRYRKILASEHERWLQGEEAMTDAHLASRRQELEVVKRYYADPGKVKLSMVIQERYAEYIQKLPLIQRSSQPNSKFQTEEEAQQAWMADVREFVMREMRLEWREDQKKILMSLAKELRSERKAAAEALNQHVQAWTKVHDAVKSAWGGELRAAQERLDQLAHAYRGAMRSIFEAELRETKKHSAEQADYFQREVAEAIKAERAEHDVSTAQLRRMRLALVKWRYDYLRDARRKAEEAADHRKASMQGGMWDEEDSIDQASPGADGGESLDENDSLVPDDTLVGGIAPHAKARTRAESERLRDCRTVLERIWQRLAVGEAERREFLLRLEEKVPASGEVLLLYQQHLAEHGVLAALGTNSEARVEWAPGKDDENDAPSSPMMHGREWQPRAGGAKVPMRQSPNRRHSRAMTGKSTGIGWR